MDSADVKIVAWCLKAQFARTAYAACWEKEVKQFLEIDQKFAE